MLGTVFRLFRGASLSKTRRPALFWGIAGAVVFGGAGGACLAAHEMELGILLFVVATVWAGAHLLRPTRRTSSLPLSLPETSRQFLESHVRFYRNLSPELRTEFESRVAEFIDANRFVGVGGQILTDELKVLAATSAVMLLFGRSEGGYPRIPEILFYPTSFNEDFETGGAGRDISGMNHPWGTVVLSAPDLERSFKAPSDGYHVGLHEFAHLLDLRNQDWDGIPAGLDPQAARPWAELILNEMKRAREGRSVLGEYAGTNEAETFAVAVEVFFERPEALRRANPDLFKALEGYFGMKTAERFKRRSRGSSRPPEGDGRSSRTDPTEDGD